MRDSAGFCASIRAHRCRPRRESGLASNGCQRFPTGVGTDRSSKAKGFRDVGNGQSTVLTNLCAPQAEKFFVPFQGGIAILIGIVAYSGRLSVTSEAPA